MLCVQICMCNYAIHTLTKVKLLSITQKTKVHLYKVKKITIHINFFF